MAILWLSDLVDAKTDAASDLPNARGNVERRREMGAQIGSKRRRIRREDVEVMGQPLEFDVGVDPVRTEKHGVPSRLEKRKHRRDDRGERKSFVRHEFTKRERRIKKEHGVG